MWTSEAEIALTILKMLLQTNTVLALPDYEKPFILSVDGCQGYMKAALLQSFGNKLRPIAFFFFFGFI